MSKKKYIGQLLEFKYSNRKEVFKGIVLDYSNDWTLLIYNPVDYVIDGFVILKNLKSLGFKKNTKDRMREKILKTKIENSELRLNLPLLKLTDIIEYVSEKYEILEFQMDSFKESYIGKLTRILSF